MISDFNGVEHILSSYAPLAKSMKGNYTLDRMRALMNVLGDPQNSYKVIHVAGTSGKTSTAYYISALLSCAGAKVGLTVSPHVDNVNERVQINNTPLSEVQYCQEFEIFIALVEALHIKPSYFELLVAFAFWEFARSGVDYAVVEVGLGGLLDGTNVVNRADKISVITDIGYDHQNILGNSLQEIASQKIGILLPKSIGFCLHQDESILVILKSRAKDIDAQLKVIDIVKNEQSLPLPLFQQRNWFLANQVVEYLIGRDSLPNLSSKQKVSTLATYIPARMEIVQKGSKTYVLDAAHNPQKMQALVPSLKIKFSDKKFVVLLSLLNSKDSRVEGVLKELLPIAEHVIVTQFEANQDLRKNSTPPIKIQQACSKLGFNSVEIFQESSDALKALIDYPSNLCLVTGSFYLLHDTHKLLLNSLPKQG